MSKNILYYKYFEKIKIMPRSDKEAVVDGGKIQTHQALRNLQPFKMQP